MTMQPTKGRGRRDDPRRQSHPPRSPAERRPDSVWIYGFHPVLAALQNPRRTVRRILATPNAERRLAEGGAPAVKTLETVTPRDLDRLLGADAVHQGIALEAEPLPALTIDALEGARLLVVLDQVTDPHNVGAIFRSAVAFGADAVVTTGRHSPVESSALAKAASGALDLIAHVEVPNLARALVEMGEQGFTRIGLDADADGTMEEAPAATKVAIVLGAEGKGLRHLTRETCDLVVRLPINSAIGSLNVSNAAVLALYLARRLLSGTEPKSEQRS
jgi:23S rRNA (guanosine2251-2'-O)-methyltransferase